MAVQNFPFDSLSAENPDRAANSKIFADYLKSFFSDGIFPVLDQFPNMHQLAVRASNPEGMSVVVDTGMGLISGRQYAQDAERTMQIPAADASLPRKDRVVLRMDLNTRYRNNDLYVKTGTAASNPQPPALTRNNVVYELALATISVAANATSITAADITDERANTDVCGYVTNVLGQVDTSVIAAQFQAFFEQTQENTADWEDAQQAAFTAWFDTIKGQLGEDAAGNLQNQIGNLDDLTTSAKDDLVTAVNEVNAKEPDVLDTMEEINANTDPGKSAGALAVKELNRDLQSYTVVDLDVALLNGNEGFARLYKYNKMRILYWQSCQYSSLKSAVSALTTEHLPSNTFMGIGSRMNSGGQEWITGRVEIIQSGQKAQFTQWAENNTTRECNSTDWVYGSITWFVE